MKILLIDSDYQGFLNYMIKKYPKEVLSYEELNSFHLKYYFGNTQSQVNAFTNKSIIASGIIANHFLFNILYLFKSHNFLYSLFYRSRKIIHLLTNLPLFSSISRKISLIIVLRIINLEAPDYVLIKDIHFFNNKILTKIKKKCKSLYGEISSKIKDESKFLQFDAIFTPHPVILKSIKAKSIKAVKIAAAFDFEILNLIDSSDRDIDIIFIGSEGKFWNTLDLLKVFRDQGYNFRIYGDFNLKNLKRINIEKYYFGQAWGLDMFKLYARSKIILNRTSDILGPYSANMRLYEATGMGGHLLTNFNPNLSDIFEIGEEISVYSSPLEALGIVKKLLEDPEKLNRIAQKGQERTLKDHLYQNRVSDMLIHIN